MWTEKAKTIGATSNICCHSYCTSSFQQKQQKSDTVATEVGIGINQLNWLEDQKRKPQKLWPPIILDLKVVQGSINWLFAQKVPVTSKNWVWNFKQWIFFKYHYQGHAAQNGVKGHDDVEQRDKHNVTTLDFSSNSYLKLLTIKPQRYWLHLSISSWLCSKINVHISEKAFTVGVK